METLTHFLFWWINTFRTPPRYEKRIDPIRIGHRDKWASYDLFTGERMAVGYVWYTRWQAAQLVRVLNRNPPHPQSQ